MYLFWRHSHPPPAFKVEQLHCDLGLFQREVRQAFSSAERNCGGKTFFKGWCLGELGNSQQYFCILGIKKKKLTLKVVQTELDSTLLALCQVCILLLFLSERFWFLSQHLSLLSSTLEPGGKFNAFCTGRRSGVTSHGQLEGSVSSQECARIALDMLPRSRSTSCRLKGEWSSLMGVKFTSK